MCQNSIYAVNLAESFKSRTGGQATTIQPAHGDCGYYKHIHVGPQGVDLSKRENHSAHIWFFGK